MEEVTAAAGAPGGATAAGPAAAPLAVEGVTFGYDAGRPVVRDFTAALEAGRVTVLIGPNAAGKSTLLRLMLGQLAPQAGRVLLCGRDAATVRPAQRAALVSYVPQRAGASFAFTVEQVVAMARFGRRGGSAAVETALAECDLTDLRGRIFSELSIGQQQRVLLARAMAQAAGGGRVMLLDEPGSALDLWHVHRMMARLAALARRGMAVLVVLHDLNLAARYADAVWLVDGGRLVAAGGWREVLAPAVLEPIYRVKLRPLAGEGHDRPVFLVEPGPAAGDGVTLGATPGSIRAGTTEDSH